MLIMLRVYPLGSQLTPEAWYFCVCAHIYKLDLGLNFALFLLPGFTAKHISDRLHWHWPLTLTFRSRPITDFPTNNPEINIYGISILVLQCHCQEVILQCHALTSGFMLTDSQPVNYTDDQNVYTCRYNLNYVCESRPYHIPFNFSAIYLHGRFRSRVSSP